MKQAGIALITVMLIVALTASVAAFMAWQQNIWVRQAENMRDQAQASAIARAAIDWARVILAEDARKNNVDHLGEPWATTLIPIAVEAGTVTGVVVDQQGLYNLNNLVRGGKASERDVAVFQRLLELLDLPPALANAVADWIDTDQDVRAPGGAEDADYLALDQPYRTANQFILDIGSLYRIKGFDKTIIERLRPFISALPEPMPINVNTAPAEVLAALIQDMPLETAKALVSARKADHFTDQADFRARLTASQANQVQGNEISVNSRYFVVTSRAEFGRSRVSYEALLSRTGQELPNIVWLKNK